MPTSLELIGDIDFILSHLLCVKSNSVIKSVNRSNLHKTIQNVSDELGVILVENWKNKINLVSNSIISKFASRGGKITELEVEKLLLNIDDVLGFELAKDSLLSVVNNLTSIYVLSRTTLKPTKVKKEFNPNFFPFKMVDEEAINTLTASNMLWIKDYYSKELSSKIADIAKTGMINGFGRKDIADDLIKHLGGRFDESQQYFRVLSSAAMHRARTFSDINTFVTAGVTTLVFTNPNDERTSEICREMIGREFHTGDVSMMMNKALSATSPDDFKNIVKWGTVKDVKDLSPRDSVLSGFAIPPLHGLCRSSLEVSDVYLSNDYRFNGTGDTFNIDIQGTVADTYRTLEKYGDKVSVSNTNYFVDFLIEHNEGLFEVEKLKVIRESKEYKELIKDISKDIPVRGISVIIDEKGNLKIVDGVKRVVASMDSGFHRIPTIEVRKRVIPKGLKEINLPKSFMVDSFFWGDYLKNIEDRAKKYKPSNIKGGLIGNKLDKGGVINLLNNIEAGLSEEERGLFFRLKQHILENENLWYGDIIKRVDNYEIFESKIIRGNNSSGSYNGILKRIGIRRKELDVTTMGVERLLQILNHEYGHAIFDHAFDYQNRVNLPDIIDPLFELKEFRIELNNLFSKKTVGFLKVLDDYDNFQYASVLRTKLLSGDGLGYDGYKIIVDAFYELGENGRLARKLIAEIQENFISLYSFTDRNEFLAELFSTYNTNSELREFILIKKDPDSYKFIHNLLKRRK